MKEGVPSTESGVATGNFYADLGEMTHKQLAIKATSDLRALLDNPVTQTLLSHGGHTDEKLRQRIESIADNPRHLTELNGIYQLLSQRVVKAPENLEQAKAEFKDRALATKERVASVMDFTKGTLEQTLYGLASTGELYDEEHVLMQLELDVDEFSYWQVMSHEAPRYLIEPMSQKGLKADDLKNVQKMLRLAYNARRTSQTPTYADKQFQDVIVFLIDTFDTEVLNGTVVPIGEYGPELARRLATTLQRLATVVKESELVFHAAEEQLGTEEVGKFVRARDNNLEESPTMLAAYEGFLSIEQALAILTAQKIEGYPYANGTTLIRDIVNSGVVEQLARILPRGGIIGPLALNAQHFNRLLLYKNGEFQVNRKTVREMHNHRKDYRDPQAMMTGAAGFPEFMTLNGCPAAIHNPGEVSSMQDMAEFFTEVFATTSQAAQEQLVS